METRLVLAVIIEDDTIFGECRATVAKWDDSKIISTARIYKAPIVVQSADDETNFVPWAVAALREASDRVIADLLEKFAKGEVILMHPVIEPQET